MAGKMITALQRQRFEFSALGSSASQTVVLVPVICAVDFNYAGVYVRVHDRSMSSGQTLDFNLYNSLPSEDDARVFVDVDGTGAPNPLVTVTVTSAVPGAVPGIVSDYSTRSGPFLRLELAATQAGTPATFYAELSAEVLLRES